MFAIDEAKLPPPTPATAAAMSRVAKETPGLRMMPAKIVGTSSSRALKIVQLRPPKVATAKVYGRRSTAPTRVGALVRRNFCDGSRPYFGPRKSTKTDHRLQIEKPMCSERIDTTRLRRATFAPVRAQKSGSSGRQSSI